MYKTKRFAKILFTATALSIAYSCNKSEHPGYDLDDNGVYYKFHTKNESELKPKAGDFVELKMVYKTDKDSVLFDSKLNSRDGSGLLQFPLQEPAFKGSVEHGIMLMSVGDSASFLVNADSLFIKTFRVNELPKGVEKGSMITFDIKLEKITSKEEFQQEQQKKAEEQKVMSELRKNEEPKIIAKYIEDNKITSNPTASGLYYIEKVKGNGKKVMPGDTVLVNYKGMFLDGNVFDTSERAGKPIEFPIGVGAVIKGWDEGIPMMSVGGKANFIIPSSIAYGEMGAGQTIPPHTPLLFEVEVVNVKSKK